MMCSDMILIYDLYETELYIVYYYLSLKSSAAEDILSLHIIRKYLPYDLLILLFSVRL